MEPGQARIGTSGWSYPSGAGTWNGVFYPPVGRRHRPRGFDELSYYAEHFDTVEINSTFYRVPTPQVTSRWAMRTPDRFEFASKLHQQFTHPKMFRVATGATDATVTPAEIETFRAAVKPLLSAGKLGVLLTQFPPSFKNDTHTRGYLEWLIGSFADCLVAVEVRHRSWSDDVGSTLRLLNGLGAAWVQIDKPKFRFSVTQNYLPNITGIYYMRLHGRNAEKWWHHDTAEERYDYLYSTTELQPVAETAKAASPLAQKLVSLPQPPLRRQGGRQRGDPEAQTRDPLRRRVPGVVRRTLSRREGHRAGHRAARGAATVWVERGFARGWRRLGVPHPQRDGRSGGSGRSLDLMRTGGGNRRQDPHATARRG